MKRRRYPVAESPANIGGSMKGKVDSYVISPFGTASVGVALDVGKGELHHVAVHIDMHDGPPKAFLDGKRLKEQRARKQDSSP